MYPCEMQVLKGIKPDQQLVKVVNDQLVELMGGTQQGLVEVKAGQTQVGMQTSKSSVRGSPTHIAALVRGAGGAHGRHAAGAR